MKLLPWVLVAVLLLVVIVLGASVVRLENYRYADSLGMCSEFFSRDDPRKRMERERCLETSQTRTHWLWHLLYGTKIL
ncbi:hypothetical protein CWO90_17580 [Bradyrhizobium sp. Leo121]|nr:hypothetical protein CWO90_17580 [Bradyrhizobium sp. Leo121]